MSMSIKNGVPFGPGRLLLLVELRALQQAF
jgi:hypothetical protein